jgi:hypothetical protein
MIRPAKGESSKLKNSTDPEVQSYEDEDEAWLPMVVYSCVSAAANGGTITCQLKSLILAVGILCSQIRDGGLVVVCTVAMLLLSLSLHLRHGEK